jgi:serine/threonine-protein kinase
VGATDDTHLSPADDLDEADVVTVRGQTMPATEDSPKRVPGRFRRVDIGTVLGRYEITDELGEGGMANVYLARDTKLRRDVAIKVLFPHLSKKREVVARFHREARAAAALEHRHILRVYDVGGGDGALEDGERDPPYIVMELVRGESLREVVTNHGPMLAEVVACIGAAVCSALGEAHRAGIIHRDVKPANVMIADGGRVALTDFGVARIEDEDSSLVTRTGALLGTPAFMSPEQAMGTELDVRSDLYSLGATLYQLATGSPPFSGPTAKVVSAITRGELVPPDRRNPTIGPALSRVILKLMAKTAEQRYESAEQAAAALAEVAVDGGLGDPDDELEAFFADRNAYTEAKTPHVVTQTLQRAREAAERRALPRAMALADRVLAMDSDNTAAVELVDQLGRGQRTRWVVLGGGALVLVAAAVVAVFAFRSSGDGEPAAVIDEYDAALIAEAEPIDAGALIPEIVPLDATSVVDDPDPIDARVKLDRRDPPRRRADAAVAVVTLPVDAAPVVIAPPPSIDARPADATVTFKMDAWCDVSIDGADHGRADPRKKITVAPGKHTFVCSQGQGMGEWRKTLTLKPGQHKDLTGSVHQSVEVLISVKAGDSVRIKSKTYRNGKRVKLRPKRYRVEVLSGGDVVSSGWVTFSRGAACALKDEPSLKCYR